MQVSGMSQTDLGTADAWYHHHVQFTALLLSQPLPWRHWCNIPAEKYIWKKRCVLEWYKGRAERYWILRQWGRRKQQSETKERDVCWYKKTCKWQKDWNGNFSNPWAVKHNGVSLIRNYAGQWFRETFGLMATFLCNSTLQSCNSIRQAVILRSRYSFSQNGYEMLNCFHSFQSVCYNGHTLLLTFCWKCKLYFIYVSW